MWGLPKGTPVQPHLATSCDEGGVLSPEERARAVFVAVARDGAPVVLDASDRAFATDAWAYAPYACL